MARGWWRRFCPRALSSLWNGSSEGTFGEDFGEYHIGCRSSSRPRDSTSPTCSARKNQPLFDYVKRAGGHEGVLRGCAALKLECDRLPESAQVEKRSLGVAALFGFAPRLDAQGVATWTSSEDKVDFHIFVCADLLISGKIGTTRDLAQLWHLGAAWHAYAELADPVGGAERQSA